MNSETYKVINPLGLHARASAILVDSISKFFPKDEVVIINLNNKMEGNAKSIMSTMMVCAAFGHEVEFLSSMSDENFEVFKKVVSRLFITLSPKGVLEHQSSFEIINGLIKLAISKGFDANGYSQLLEDARSSVRSVAYMEYARGLDIVNGEIETNSKLIAVHNLNSALVAVRDLFNENNISQEDQKMLSDISREIYFLSQNENISRSEKLRQMDESIEKISRIATNTKIIGGALAPVLKKIFEWFW